MELAYALTSSFPFKFAKSIGFNFSSRLKLLKSFTTPIIRQSLPHQLIFVLIGFSNFKSLTAVSFSKMASKESEAKLGSNDRPSTNGICMSLRKFSSIPTLTTSEAFSRKLIVVVLMLIPSVKEIFEIDRSWTPFIFLNSCSNDLK